MNLLDRTEHTGPRAISILILVTALAMGCGAPEDVPPELTSLDAGTHSTTENERQEGPGDDPPDMSPQPEGADAGVGSDAGAVEMADMGDLNAPDAAEGGPVDGGELPPDGSIPDENPDEGGTCDRIGFNPRLTETALTDFGLQHIAIEGNYENFVITRIFEDFGGPRTTGRYALDGINYRDCGLCLVAQRGCAGDVCQQTFYADEGDVVITELSPGRFAARFEDVVFHQVTIDPNTNVSTRIPDGEQWCMDDYAFAEDFEIVVADGGHPDNPPVCQEAVACVGETIQDFQLINCATGRPESMRQYFNGQEAAVLMAVAGWCPGCSETLPRTVQAERQVAASGVKFAYILGEDRDYQQPSLAYCQRYAADHGVPLNQMFIDHDGQDNHMTTFSNVWPYLDANGAVVLPYKAVIDVGTWMVFYSDRAPGMTFPQAIDAAIAPLP